MTLRLFFLVIFFFFHASSLFAGMETFPFLAQVKSNKVNIRAGQSANFEALALLNRGDTVIVVAKEYSWYKVRLPGSAKSFVSDKYVKLISSQEGEITGSRVNVRAAANVNNTVVAQLSSGSKIKILEKFKDWVRIEPVEESFGWISQEFLEFQSNDFSSENVIVAGEHALKASFQEVNQEPIKEKKFKEDALVSLVQKEKSSAKGKDTQEWVKAKVASIKKDSVPAPVAVVKPAPAPAVKEIKVSSKPSKEKKLVEAKKSNLPKKPVEEKKPRNLKKAVKEEKIISLMGILKPALPPISPSVQFVLEVQGKPPYGIQGDKKELEKYLYSVVTVEGVLKNKQFDSAASILEIKKIEVVAKNP